MNGATAKGVAVALDIASIVMSLALLAFILALVLTRYVLGWSVVGLHELALLAAMWLYMVGGVTASRRNEHLIVDFLHQRMTDPRTKAWHGVVVSAISAVILCLFVYWAYRLMAWGIRLPQTTSALNISLLIPESAIMFGSVGCLVYAVRDFVVAVSTLRNLASPGH